MDSEFQNNVIYNWGKKNSLYGGENDTAVNHDANGNAIGYCRVYMQNNYFRAGPTTFAAGLSDRYFVQGSKDKDYGQWYLSGNKFETGNKFNATARDIWTDDALALVNQDNLYGYVTGERGRSFNLDGKTPSQSVYDEYVLSAPLASSNTALQSADEAFADVTESAGASLPRYDEEDMRLLMEAKGEIDPEFVGQTAKTYIGIIDSQEDITFSAEDHFFVGDKVYGGYPSLDAMEGDSLVLDSDGDGMPDLYETEHNMNAQDPADGAILTAQGYSNLEIYLNGVASGLIDKTSYESLPYVSLQPETVDDAIEEVSGEKRVENGEKRVLLDGATLLIEKEGVRYSLEGNVLL